MGIRNLFLTCLLSKGIGDDEVVAVICRREANKICKISWPGGAWLILQTLVVCLDLFTIHPHLDLTGKCNV
jgi:hypothetical protein